MRFFTLMPASVVGATCRFVFLRDHQGRHRDEIASRMLDAQRTKVVGLALMTGLAVEPSRRSSNPFPGVDRAAGRLATGAGHVRGPRVEQSVHRIGSRRRAALDVDPHVLDFAAVQTFVEPQRCVGRAAGRDRTCELCRAAIDRGDRRHLRAAMPDRPVRQLQRIRPERRATQRRAAGRKPQRTTTPG